MAVLVRSCLVAFLSLAALVPTAGVSAQSAVPVQYASGRHVDLSPGTSPRPVGSSATSAGVPTVSPTQLFPPNGAGTPRAAVSIAPSASQITTTPSALPSGTVSALYVATEGSFLFQGPVALATTLYTPPARTFAGTIDSALSTATVDVDDGSTVDWEFDFVAAPASVLSSGGSATLTVRHNSNVSRQQTVTTRDLSFSGTTLTSLSVKFDTCPGNCLLETPGDVAFMGELRLNSADPIQAPLASYATDIPVGQISNQHQTLDLGITQPGTTSAPKVITLTNAGNATITSLGIGWLDTTYFHIGTEAGACAGSTLAPGASCTVTVTFSPSALGYRESSIGFTGSFLGGTLGLIPVSGSAFLRLSLSSSGTGTGSIQCANSCPFFPYYGPGYFDGSVKAVADQGSFFSGWGGDCAGTTAPTCTLDPSTAHSVSASFTATLLPGNPQIRSAGIGRGLSDADMQCATRPCYYASPVLGVSPTQVVQLDLASVRVTDRSGQVLTQMAGDDFFASPFAPAGVGQPEVVWDTVHSRWLATRFITDCSTQSYVDLAVSDTANAVGGWTVYSWSPVSSNRLGFRPRVGFSSDKVVLGFDEKDTYDYCANGKPVNPEDDQYTSSDLLVMDTASLYALPSSLPYAALRSQDATRWAWTPAIPLTTGATVRLAATNPADRSLRLGTVTGTVSGGTASLADAAAPAGTRVSGGMGPSAAFVRNTDLWLGGLGPCPSTGTLCYNAARVSLSGTVPALTGTWSFGEGSTLTVDTGSLGLAQDGTLFAVYLARSTTTAASTLRAAYVAPADASGTFHEPTDLLNPSAYTGVNWCSFLPADPSDASAVWQAVPASEGSGWSTWVSKLTAGAAATPSGMFALDGGATAANEYLVDLTTASTAGSGVTQVRVSNVATTSGGVLSKARVYPSGGRQSWDLSDPSTGGSMSTGSRTVYLQWGDGAGSWSAPTSKTLVVSPVPGSMYVAVPPTRVLDTRTGNGLSGMFVSRTPRSFQVTGRAGIPSNAIAVTGNVTVTGQTAAGYVTVAPSLSTSTVPSVSTINFPLGDNRANGVTVTLSATGSLAAEYVAVIGAKTSLVFDVTGYFARSPGSTAAAAMTFHPLATPVRVVDTRSKLGLSGKLSAGYLYGFYVAGTHGIPSAATGVTANVTIPAGATAGGFVTVAPVFPASLSQLTSTINFKTTDNRANNATLPLGPWGTLSAYYAAPSGNSTNLVIDITGYFTSDAGGASYVPLTPARILDTRYANGTTGPVPARIVKTFQVTGRGGVATDAAVVTGNVTIVGQTASGYITVAPSLPSGTPPPSSTLNAPVGDVRANGIDVGLGSGGTLSFEFWATSGQCQAVFDVGGYFH